MAWDNGEGSLDSTVWTSMAPDSTLDHRSTRPSTESPSCRQSCTVWRASTWSGTPTGPAGAFSWQAASPGHTAASRSSDSMRWRWIGRRLPPFMRGMTSARVRFQRQRAASIGCSRTAWVSACDACAARQHGLHAGEREAVLRAEREDDGVVVRRRLQLEVEGHAEALAQCEAERPVDPPTEGGVDDELRALALVEAALDHDALAGREVTERIEPGGAVGHHLLGHLRRDAGALAAPGGARRRRRRRAARGSSAARRSLTASESSAVRAGASPNQKGTVGGRSPASCTRTVPTSTLATRHEWVPRRKMSPAVASTAKSSCTEPTVTPSGSSTTR